MTVPTPTSHGETAPDRRPHWMMGSDHWQVNCTCWIGADHDSNGDPLPTTGPFDAAPGETAPDKQGREMADPYTMALRLCDDDGLVSNERADPQPEAHLNLTYLDMHNNMASFAAYRGCAPITKPFACTGSAHYAGEHIRCTSPAHKHNRISALLDGARDDLDV